MTDSIQPVYIAPVNSVNADENLGKHYLVYKNRTKNRFRTLSDSVEKIAYRIHSPYDSNHDHVLNRNPARYEKSPENSTTDYEIQYNMVGEWREKFISLILICTDLPKLSHTYRIDHLWCQVPQALYRRSVFVIASTIAHERIKFSILFP